MKEKAEVKTNNEGGDKRRQSSTLIMKGETRGDRC
jgi:hypothetical protein